MTDEDKKDWGFELERLKAQVRFALNNLDSLSKRNDVKGQLEVAYFTLYRLCEHMKEQP